VYQLYRACQSIELASHASSVYGLYHKSSSHAHRLLAVVEKSISDMLSMTNDGVLVPNHVAALCKLYEIRTPFNNDTFWSESYISIRLIVESKNGNSVTTLWLTRFDD